VRYCQKLAGVHVSFVQVSTNILVPNPIAASDPNRRQLPRLDEPVHRHVGDPELPRNLCHRKETPQHGGRARWWTRGVAHVERQYSKGPFRSSGSLFLGVTVRPPAAMKPLDV
jgi:hypothetical protein